MPVDPVLASYSDLAYHTSLLVYLLAMAFHAVEYGVGQIPAPTRRRVSVGAAPAGPSEQEVGEFTDGAGSSRRGRAERIGRTAVALTVLAALVHGTSLLLRGAATGRAPWGNMYEFTSALCFAAVLAWLVVLYRQRRSAPRMRRMGMFVLLPTLVLMFLGSTVLYTEAAPLIPALDSYWIVIHVSAAATATGILLVSGVASLLYVVRERLGASSRVAAQLPGSETADRLAYRTAIVAFPIWTFAVISGALWAEAAWGRYWGWDPKETVALVAWVIYAGYLHARATAGWRGSRAAWINILGLAVMLFNLFFINMVISGLHSYAGI